MKEYRSASQILFGFLPEQTVDLKSAVWKVKKWRNPYLLTEVDTDTLRRDLIKRAMPWQAQQKDGNYVRDLLAGREVRVYSLDRQNGVEVEPFPKIWLCKRCKRLLSSPDGKCRCGFDGAAGQLHFVGFCEKCGSIHEPWIASCSEHKEAKVVFPGTASATEIRFVCPICDKVLSKGFGFRKCTSCGKGNLSFNVHRAASVYTPHSIVIVNPPSREKIRELESVGGAPKALAWVVDGMDSKTVKESAPSREALRRSLVAQGLDEPTVSRMLAAALGAHQLRSKAAEVDIPLDKLAEAESEAITIALATSESRVRIIDLIDSTEDESFLRSLYRNDYAAALLDAGIHSVEFVDKFPVMTGVFGYTRGKSEPGASRLVPFRDRTGAYVVYGDLAETEALFIRLDPIRVASWLGINGFELEKYVDARSARLAILRAASLPTIHDASPPRNVGSAVLNLVHSFAHRFIRRAAVRAGIETSSLSELLVPLHLGFFVYAAARGDFVLGGLQAVFESELHILLRDIVHGEHRCALDPGCSRSGGACMACLHLGEPSCRLYNRFLSRDVLNGPRGFLRSPKSF
jgi:RNase P subunit RPR2